MLPSMVLHRSTRIRAVSSLPRKREPRKCTFASVHSSTGRGVSHRTVAVVSNHQSCHRGKVSYRIQMSYLILRQNAPLSDCKDASIRLPLLVPGIGRNKDRVLCPEVSRDAFGTGFYVATLRCVLQVRRGKCF